jgi:hypothetical protein
MKCSNCGSEIKIIDFLDISDCKLDSDTNYCVSDFENEEARAWVCLRQVLDMDDPIADSGYTWARFDDRRQRTPVNAKLLKQVLNGQRLGVVASCYRHSADTWYRRGSRSMPDERWDVADTAGVLVPDPCTIRYWRKASKRKYGTSVRDQLEVWADSVLDEYTSYCNGWFVEVGIALDSNRDCPSCICMRWDWLGSWNFVSKSITKADADDIRGSVKELLTQYMENKKKNEVIPVKAEELEGLSQ